MPNESKTPESDKFFAATFISNQEAMNFARQLELSRDEWRKCAYELAEKLRYVLDKEQEGYIGFCGMPHKKKLVETLTRFREKKEGK